LSEGKNVVVVGSSFIGMEVAAALVGNYSYLIFFVIKSLLASILFISQMSDTVTDLDQLVTWPFMVKATLPHP
jgi:hypothetical protein